MLGRSARIVKSNEADAEMAFANLVKMSNLSRSAASLTTGKDQ